LTTATRLAPNSDAAHFTLGAAYDRKGDQAAALTAYKRAIALNPKHAPAYNNVAYLYATQAKNLDEALALAQKARDLQPNAGTVIDTLGFVHYQRGEYQQAEPLFKKASELVPRNATIFYHLGTTYYKLGRHADATTALRRSLQIDDRIPQAAEIQTLLTEMKK
jgi:Flp pilus assembly protein TadD